MAGSRSAMTLETGLSIWQILAAWATWAVVSGRLDERTVKAYRRSLVALMADIGAPLTELTEEMLLAHIGDLDPRGSKRNDLLRALRAWTTYCAPRGYLPHGDPMADFRVRRAPRGPVRFLDEKALGAFLEASRAHPDERCHPALTLLVSTGVRVGSLVGCRPEDVTLEPPNPNIWWRAEAAKAGRAYRSPLHPDHSLPAASRLVLLAAEGYTRDLGGRRQPTLLGVKSAESVRGWMREVCKAAGLPKTKATPHALRRTFAVRLARPGMDYYSLIELMGWSSGSELRRYVSVSDDRLVAAVGNLALPAGGGG